MADYQSRRDRAVDSMYDLTTDLATLEPPSPQMHELLLSSGQSQAGMNLFARVNAGVTAPHELLAAVT
jgi:hypothetical protein